MPFTRIQASNNSVQIEKFHYEFVKFYVCLPLFAHQQAISVEKRNKMNLNVGKQYFL